MPDEQPMLSYTEEEIQKARKATGDRFTSHDISSLTRRYLELLQRAEKLDATERERRKKSRDGMEARARIGHYNGGNEPYGFRWSKEREVWERVEDEIRVLKDIKVMRASGATFQGVADDLNGQHIPTPKGGTKWYPSTIRALLHNPFYDEQLTIWGGVQIDMNDIRAARATAATGVFVEDQAD